MAHHASTHSLSNLRLGDAAKPVVLIGGIVGVAFILISLAIAVIGERAWDQFMRSYLMAFMFVLSICLGALFFTILQHCVKAGWSVVVRRLAESVASNLQWIWILFLPILYSALTDTGHLYHWLHVVDANGHVDEVLAAKSAYFYGTNAVHEESPGKFVQSAHTPWFWIIRAVFFFGLWAMLARFFVGNSVAQDTKGDPEITRKMERFAPISIGLYFITQAFAAMDWVMSIEPHWFSTMFPVYFFAASCCGYFSMQILMMFFTQRAGYATREITNEHYQDAGKLLFAFGIVFWAYIAYSQYMLIWYANLPEETPWYMARQLGGWKWVTLLLLFGHFLVPFLILISRHPKRMKPVLAAAAGWMLFLHAVDIYWLTMPRVPAGDLAVAKSYTELVQNVSNAEVNFGYTLLDLTCLLGLASLLLAGTVRKLGGVNIIPVRDPRLHESLAFENI